MAIPNVDPVAALVFRAAIDDPSRFLRSRDVAAYFALPSKRWQSGASSDVQGRISKAGDPGVRRALYEAASAMLTRYKGKTALKSWGQKFARCCHKKAMVAARKFVVIMHAMWRDGTAYADRPRAASRPATRRPLRNASFSAFSHDVRRSLQPQIGVRLNALKRSAAAEED